MNCVLKIFFLTALLVLSGTGSARAACSTPTANVGAIEFYTATKVFKYCDGTNWVNFQTTPVTVTGGGPFIMAGTNSTCAVRSDNVVMCWGYNMTGVVGDGTTTERSVPTAISGGGVWNTVSLDHGTTHSDFVNWVWEIYSHRRCGIKVDGSIWCWGTICDGYSGCTATIPACPEASTPSLFDAGPWKVMETSGSSIGTSDTVSGACPSTNHVSYYRECGIKMDNTLWCWGRETDGGLGNGGSLSETQLTPVQISGGGTWKAVDVGGTPEGGHGCGIKSNDTLWCWGKNTNNALGDGTTTNRAAPVQVSGGGTWKTVSAGIDHTCAIKTDDTLWCWGLGTSGQLGDGTSTTRSSPVAISGGGTWKQVAAGGGNWTCGIKSDDTLWCWGINTGGILGDNTTTTRNAPVSVNGGGTWSSVSTGISHTCGIKTNGTAWCWGRGFSGKLGNGSTSDSLIPSAVSGGHTWKTNATDTCPVDGQMYYDLATSKFRYCNGASILQLNCSSGGCGTLGACTKAGSMGYLSAKYAYCDGANWQVLAP